MRLLLEKGADANICDKVETMHIEYCCIGVVGVLQMQDLDCYVMDLNHVHMWT